MTNNPNLTELQAPPKLEDVLTEQQKDYDCLPCRMMGSAAFTGLGIYSYASGTSQLKKRELEILNKGGYLALQARKAGVLGISAVLVGMGVYRLKY